MAGVAAFGYPSLGWPGAAGFATIERFFARHALTSRDLYLLENSGSVSMLETNPIHTQIKDLSERTDVLRGYL
ncbi:hypothetical protein BCL93_102396 [Onishia taeanensis]|uniref:Uncharacterized protein n=1 Tax=Onishia taeanensis TaxID=284577 RepID=A0A328XWB9_9GAMM|nr:hypothetical protein BCL93_102396 [Halomonas taeanensis]